MRLAVLSGAVLLCAAACSPKPAEDAKVPAPAPAAPAAEAVDAAKVNKEQEIETPGAHRDGSVSWRSDTADVVVAAKGDPQGGDKLEYKINVKAGDVVTYRFDADDATNLWHEFHGHDPKVVSFYKKAGGSKHEGVLIAPFTGSHGWYFENRGDKQVIVRVDTAGFYTLEKKE